MRRVISISLIAIRQLYLFKLISFSLELPRV